MIADAVVDQIVKADPEQLAVVAAGLLITGVLARAALVMDANDEVARAAVGVIRNALAGELNRWVFVIAGIGVALAIVASLLRTDDVSPATPRLGVGLSSGVTSGEPRATVALGALLAGGLLIVDWQLAIGLAATAVGFAFATYGVVVLLGVVRRRRTTSVGETAGGQSGWTTRPGWIVGGLAAIVLLVAVIVAIDRSSGHAVAETVSDPRCNGSVLLRERSLREVAIAATHNSMAAAEDGAVQASQTAGIVPQLDAGFRGLLIDVYFGLATDDVVITDRAPLTEVGRAELVGEVGDAAVRAARSHLGPRRRGEHRASVVPPPRLL